LDPWRAAAAGLALEGEAGPADLPRLAEALEALVPDGAGSAARWPARYSLVFQRDEAGRCVVTGTCVLEIRPTCQRCLGRVDLGLDCALSLALIASEAQADDLPPALDPAVVEDDRLRPLDLVEEELLLALPLVPMHPAGDCPGHAAADPEPSGADVADEEARENPFAVLAALRKAENESKP
jgi:uncharacterized protein